MQVEAISNNQNFEGKFVILGKFSKHNTETLLNAKKLLQDRVTFAPFDVYVKEGKNNRILMSYTKSFKEQYPVFSFSQNPPYPRVFDYARMYEKMRSEIAERIKKENFIEKVKYFLGIKKYIG